MKEIEKIKRSVSSILKKGGVKRAGIFGSRARGDAKKNSDVDILVDIKENISLLQFISLKMELEKKLKRKVDLVEYKCVKPRLMKQIFSEEVRIL